MKWKIYKWLPAIKISIYIACLLYWGYLIFEELKQDNLISGLSSSTMFFCFLLPICMDQIDKLTKQKMGIINDEREKYISRKTGHNTLNGLKIICPIIVLALAFMSYYSPSMILTGIILGVGTFMIIMYLIEMVLYFYYQRIE